MKKKSIILLIATLISLVIYPSQSLADEFDQLTLRLESTKINSSIDAYVCAQASSSGAGVENSLTITFPSTFTIPTSTSSWTTSYTDLPPGSTNWPGISTNPTAISGKTLTLDSSDLTTNTLYCFRLESSTSSTGTSIGSKVGTLTTKNNSDTTIDTEDFAVNIVTNNAVTLTATVPASPTDFSATLTKTEASNTFPQNFTIPYKITYSSSLTYPTQVEVQAEWTKASGSIDVFDYVIGSATNGYNNATPVIDSVNRTITWTLPSFPGNNAEYTVNFSLRTNSIYTSPGPLPLSVSGRVLGPGTQTADSTLSGYYAYDDPNTSDSSNSDSGSSSSSNNSQPTTSNPTPITSPSPQTPISISTTEIRRITNDTAIIYTNLNTPGIVTINYGTSTGNLTKSKSSNSNTFEHLITLSDLLQNTKYYYKITATSPNGSKKTSDIFTFKTASSDKIPYLDPGSFIFTSQKIILQGPVGSALQTSKIISIPIDTEFEFRFAIPDNSNIKKVHASIRNTKILGASMPTSKNSSLELIETSPGIYLGNLATPNTNGIYELVIRIDTNDGILTENELTRIKVTSPIRVIDATTKDPIEDARIELYIWNTRLKQFINIKSQHFQIDNPSYTDSFGELKISFPNGKYKADISAFNYKKTSIEFTVSDSEKDNYPTIALTTSNLNPIELFSYIIRTIQDVVIKNTDIYINSLSTSRRIFHLSSIFSLICLSLLLIISFGSRTQLAFRHLPKYLAFHIGFKKVRLNTATSLSGLILDSETNTPIKHANIYITLEKTQKFIAQSFSQANGMFKISDLDPGEYTLTILQYKYQIYESELIIDENPKSLSIKISKNATSNHPLRNLKHYLLHLSANSFEALLFITVLLSLLSGSTIGWSVVLPYLIIALVNLVLWTSHQALK